VIVNPTPAPKPPAPPPPPAADPAPSDPQAPAADSGTAPSPIETTPIVNPDDPALTNNVVDEATAGTEQVEGTLNAIGDGAGAQPPPPPTWFERLQAAIPWWPIPAVLLGLGAIAYGIRKTWTPASAPALYPTWDIESGMTAIDGELPAIPGWPSFSARTAIEWGGASLPEPLPLAEEENG
jgi:hypothetical protein